MSYANSVMANQVMESSVNNTVLLENAFSVKAVKEEECTDEDFEDDKVQISKSAPITELQDKIDQYDMSTTLDNIKTEPLLPEIQYVMIQDNLKIEEGFSRDHVKTEFNKGLLYCEDCQVYREDYCTECEMLVHILNKTVPFNADNKSQEELPNDILEIRHCFDGYRIFAARVIPVRVKFGPFTGLNTVGHPWKIKGGKFVVNKDKSKYLNWMQYITPARNILEQNLQVFQYEHNLYYESTHRIEEGDELLVHFGEEYEDNMNRNVEMNFTPATKQIFKDVFACTFCCLGFSSKSYLAKHKTICPENATEEFTIEELVQCPSCKIHLDQREYFTHHMAYCKGNDRKCNLPTRSTRVALINRRKTRPHQMYKCQQCKYRTKYKGDLKNHTNQHHELKMYKCEVCCRRFKTKEALTLHVDNTQTCAGGKEYSEHSWSQDEAGQFKCSSCDFRTKYKTSLKKHMAAKHIKRFKYKCDTCDYKANVKSSLKRHIEERHLKEFKYKCDRCDYKTNRKSYLKAHTETKHLNEFKYKCDTCGYKTHWKPNLKMHMEIRHLKEFKYKCDLCDYKANVKCWLKRHIEARHLKEFKYKCDACEYKANQKSHLKRHIEGKHLKDFKHKCDTCDYKTNVRSSLKTHIEAKHLKEFKYKCDMCDYKVNSKSQLEMHIETKHLKEFKYKCYTCDYKTSLKCHLKNHIETKHLREFKYKCDTCDYKTNLKCCLKAHVATKHLKEFKYKCDRCDYKANQKSNLMIHVKSKHLNEFNFKCEICEYKTNIMSNLKKHIKSRHP